MKGRHPRTAANIFSCLQYQKRDEEGTERMKLDRVASNSSVHIFLLEAAMPRAGAAESECDENSYSDKHLSTHPE